jgi:3-oxoacyl-[acyl-carrier-protein] synthase II
MPSRVVISGTGVLSPAGRGVSVLASAIREGRTFIAPDHELRRLGTRAFLSARVPDVDAAFEQLPIDAAAHAFFGRFSRIGAIAALDAVADAGSPAIGRVILGTAVGPMGELEACFRDTLSGVRHPSRTHAVTRVTPSFLATFLAGRLGASRGGRMVSCACVSALEALRDAVDLVASGAEDACLAGAVDEDSASTWWAFDAQRLLSQAVTPETRTRSLSGKPGGFVPSGGAAFFVVEREDVARARLATSKRARELVRVERVSIRAQTHASSLIAFPDAAYRAALADVCEADVRFDLVLAHAPPTFADADELSLVDDALALGASGTPVRSFKSMTGYALGAAAAFDVALAVYQIRAGEVLANDLGSLEPSVKRLETSLAGPSTRTHVRRVLKTAYAQGGVAGAIVLAKGDGE